MPTIQSNSFFFCATRLKAEHFGFAFVLWFVFLIFCSRVYPILFNYWKPELFFLGFCLCYDSWFFDFWFLFSIFCLYFSGCSCIFCRFPFCFVIALNDKLLDFRFFCSFSSEWLLNWLCWSSVADQILLIFFVLKFSARILDSSNSCPQNN